MSQQVGTFHWPQHSQAVSQGLELSVPLASGSELSVSDFAAQDPAPPWGEVSAGNALVGWSAVIALGVAAPVMVESLAASPKEAETAPKTMVSARREGAMNRRSMVDLVGAWLGGVVA